MLPVISAPTSAVVAVTVSSESTVVAIAALLVASRSLVTKPA